MSIITAGNMELELLPDEVERLSREHIQTKIESLLMHGIQAVSYTHLAQVAETLDTSFLFSTEPDIEVHYKGIELSLIHISWEILCTISNLSNMYNVTAMLPRMAPWSSWLVIRPFQGCDAGSIPAGVILPLFPFFCGGRLIKTS